ncbi:glycerol-3-phosphate acyltransferase [Phormidium sp. LEGE 05292]|uniref:glycerol-3-phosphate acyltransferase n=1 Tax=[Phormidium] sp. LEGE 05292 TaxID=767427 RepID=UPI001880FDC0|nr:glycerol-3-phosphate acyltransferase [Phormidium sp. LEGE 05292]MBE9228649.1 glycerol-3-phosphate acyltransferase [Phormidium sp. LEGE 05292]
MTLMQAWGVLLIFVFCPLLGGLPLIAWITYALTGQNLARLGTGNVGVQAAFYHGGTVVGVLAVISEALKGIIAVLLARIFFPPQSEWEIIALIALVLGRYWIGKGAGTTNVVWGFVVHDPIVAFLVFVIGGISFTLIRERQTGKLSILVLFPLIVILLYSQDYERIVSTIVLAVVMGWIYQKIPDDLDLPTSEVRPDSQKMFRFFRGDRSMISLNQKLNAAKVGQKAATLSQLKRWGYAVPDGWVLLPGDDPEPIIESLQPSLEKPLVVRSSAIGEDSETASAAGQYDTILNVSDRTTLRQAIIDCQTSYDRPGAVQYRLDRNLPEAAMAVLIQKQVRGAFSGVAFSRDPIAQSGDNVIIEALPGGASQIVSGQVTPEQYRVTISDLETAKNSDSSSISVQGEGDVPLGLIRQVAILARELENRYHGIPQDIEWSYDGDRLWLLQSRPITTLSPIWTRKIAAEVIPGLIRPLTWSINRPLTCGVWGDIFTIVLGTRAKGLDFNETATLHYSRAYFNASLLGQIFRRMGLPPESLEFLTRGAKFSKPPLISTLRNVPGLFKLWQRERRLSADFVLDDRQHFTPGLTRLKTPESSPDPQVLLNRIDFILALLRKATYYSILAPLSFALRKAIFRVKDAELNAGKTPEVASLRTLTALAAIARKSLINQGINPEETANILDTLATTESGQKILQEFEQILERYGYLSDVATDIAVPTWKEESHHVREIFAQFIVNPPPPVNLPKTQTWQAKLVQRRLNLKGRVTEIYSQLLAELRWSLLELERIWLSSGLLKEAGDIFFLELSEIHRIINETDRELPNKITQLIEKRRSQLSQHQQLETTPFVVYGNAPPITILKTASLQPTELLQGIGASPGQAEGRVKVLRNLQSVPEINRETILVVPYTDSGWAPLLARAGGLISEVGGRLSHGAIVAREYGIPAIMDIQDATRLLKDGQLVRIDGQIGTVEIL